jgi:hypothetical protein
MTTNIELSARTVRELGGGCVEVDAPNGWEDVKQLQGKVLRINASLYGFTGWNSDRNVAYFKQGQPVAYLS